MSSIGPMPVSVVYQKERIASAYVIYDVDIHDTTRYQDFMQQVKPAIEAAGAR